MDKIRKIICVLIGHSWVQTQFFGYYYCARCEEQVGDALGSIYNASAVVLVGHNCDKCRQNYKQLTWRDKFLVPRGWKPEPPKEDV